ncbi:hypothetical protein WN943_005320 [Citrus x changshan-huyou]
MNSRCHHWIGNNNDLSTNSKANYSPFGVDFGGKPTGRFSNSRNEADFMGSADTGYGYDGFESKVNISYTFSGFTEFLTVEFAGELMQRLYALGAPKFLLNNIFANGCIPLVVNREKPKTLCSEAINKRTRLFNNHLFHMLPHLESILQDQSSFVQIFMKLCSKP